MKKLLAAILAIFCFTGVSFAKTYNVKANDETVTMKKSDVIVIELSENASTGYGWEFKSSDENVAKIIEKKSVYPKQPMWKPPTCGQGGTAVYKIKAINKGTAMIYGAYIRSWEKNPPIREYSLKIVVE